MTRPSRTARPASRSRSARSGCTPAPGPSGRSGGREDEAERDGDPDQDAQRGGTPGRAVDRSERLVAVRVVVVAVVVAMIVERVMLDRARVAGHVVVVRRTCHAVV